jgi:hypothetical protein
MKEREIRERIERAMHMVTMSATLGVTMSLAGCVRSQAVYEAVMPENSQRDTSTGTYQPVPDAAADFPSATPMYTAQIPDAQASDTAAPDATIDDSSDDVADRS